MEPRSSLGGLGKRLRIAMQFALVLFATGACQQYARITWESPQPAGGEEKTPLAVADLSLLKLQGQAWDEGRPQNTIGRHTWTVFALPGAFL